jgi:hypothetical protein
MVTENYRNGSESKEIQNLFGREDQFLCLYLPANCSTHNVTNHKQPEKLVAMKNNDDRGNDNSSGETQNQIIKRSVIEVVAGGLLQSKQGSRRAQEAMGNEVQTDEWQQRDTHMTAEAE